MSPRPVRTDDVRHRDLRNTRRPEGDRCAREDLRAGAGFWVITDPAGTVELVVVVTGPTVKFALVIALVAAACVRPTTFGTATCDGPLETKNRIPRCSNLARSCLTSCDGSCAASIERDAPLNGPS
jgi:hypothetical protein